MPTPAFCAIDDVYGQLFNKKKNENTVNNNTSKVCPNCEGCIGANNYIQQQVLNQNLWPRPRWVPQGPSAYESYDPYNRYWMNIKEEFGNLGDGGGVLQLILFVLIVLFVIQLFELLFGGSK
jgi:hypothetical protein